LDISRLIIFSPFIGEKEKKENEREEEEEKERENEIFLYCPKDAKIFPPSYNEDGRVKKENINIIKNYAPPPPLKKAE
jgi:hypothetical protein